MESKSDITFGDNVKVVDTEITRKFGVAGLTGSVYGETTPSVTNVYVIGELQEDFALNVYFENLDKDYWFATQLLEFMDHAPGTEITLEGVDKKWIRNDNGEWIESDISNNKKRPWWKFW
jgi:hypothetical protein